MSKRTWLACACLALAAIALSRVAHAQTYQDEYLRRLKVFQTIDPHGETPFGEQLNPYTGDLSFKQTDVLLPGIGPTISLVRQTASFQRSEPRLESRALGDWELSIPRIETIVGGPRGAGFPPGTLWKGGPSGTERCTHFSMPTYYMNPDMWHGFTLFTEDGNQQELLKRDASNTRQPSMTHSNGQPVVFPAVTTQNWQIGCLPATSNGEVGEAFLVVSPDGTRYWLDYLVGDPMNDYIERDIFGNVFYGRMLATMYVTRIEDRFGNWIKYQYNGDEKLDAITASDGRYVTITWRSDRRVIDHITVEPGTGQRVWQYTYNGEKLANVILPDASRWTFDLHGIGGDSFPSDWASKCTTRIGNSTSSSPEVSTLVHPSGLEGAFTLNLKWHARSYVASSCHNPPDQESYEAIPSIFITSSLTRKEFSGAGMAARTWTYAYPEAIGSALRDSCAGNGSCPDEKDITITTPAGDRVIHTYSNRWGAHEGKLLTTKYYQGTTTLLRTETHAYMQSDAGPWPATLGNSLVTGNSNKDLQQTWTPQRQRTTTQQGATFQYAVNTFDSFARSLTVVRDSSLNSGRVEVTSYHDKLDDWVLGQVSQVLSDGLVMLKTDFDPATALPLRSYSFGLLQQTLTYNTNGTLATVKDGNNNITTLSNWKRGIPQRIEFPATPDQPGGTAISAMVNDLGGIDWTIDETNAKTCYDYDPLGRLKQITYPSESQYAAGVCDASTWAPTYRTFSFVDPIYGLPSHWRLWERTGNGYKVTHYDALRRPVVEDTYDYGDVADTRSIVVKRYDAAGRLAFQSYPMRTLDNYAAVTWGTRTSYDALDRVTRVEQDSELGDLVTTTEYLAGFQSRVTNPRGFATTTSFLAYDQPSTDWPVAITHPEGAYTSIVRDVFGKPTALSRRNADSSVWNGRYYAYDQYQRLCKLSEPETGTNAMGYDNAGNLLWSAAGQSWSPTGACLTPEAVAARRVDRQYDARNRLLALEFPDGQGDQYWSYTPDGLPAQVSTFDAGQETINAYTYNKRRMLTGEAVSQLYGWGTWSLGYGYNANGHLSVQVYPGGMTIPYAPNALGQATQAGSFASGVSRYPNGAIEQFNYGNGIVYSMLQNARQLPAWVTASSGAMHYSYNYDANANATQIDSYLGPDDPDRTMTYDGLDRLKTAASPMWGGTLTYGYDQIDNLTTLTGAGRNLRYCYNGNKQLTFVRSNATSCSNGSAMHAMDYDVQGNVASKDEVGYQFDFGNRLREVVGKETYRYDALGRRVRATSPVDGDIISVYSHGGQLMFQQDYRRNINSNYVYLDGSLVAIQEIPIGGGATTVKYQHTDALGSPVAVTSSTKAVLDRMQYEPFGKRIGGVLKDGPGYTGHVFDTQTGMNYMQDRYYDPDVGRFVSVDAVSAYGGDLRHFNRYAYAYNNPYRYTDPDGRVPRGSSDLCRMWCDSSYVAGEGGGGSSDQDSGNDDAATNEVKGLQATRAGIFKEAGETYEEAGIVVVKEAAWMALPLGRFLGKLRQLIPLRGNVAGRLSNEISKHFGAVGRATQNAKGQRFLLADGRVAVRVMSEGGGRKNYIRISVRGKGSVDATGAFTNDPARSHIPISADSLRLINDVISGLD